MVLVQESTAQANLAPEVPIRDLLTARTGGRLVGVDVRLVRVVPALVVVDITADVTLGRVIVRWVIQIRVSRFVRVGVRRDRLIVGLALHNNHLGLIIKRHDNLAMLF